MSNLSNLVDLPENYIVEIMHTFEHEDYSRSQLAQLYGTTVEVIDILLDHFEKGKQSDISLKTMV